MTDILNDLSVKQLPEIQGYHGPYVNEDWVLETFSSAAKEIKRLRHLNEKAAKCLSVATAALGTLSMSMHSGSHIASHALKQMSDTLEQ